MKRIAGLLLVAVVAAALTSAVPAAAKKKAKPVATKLFLHGDGPVGESQSVPVVSDAMLPMDPTEPAGAEPKSKFITNYLVGPNTECSGNNLFPVWSGAVSGTIKGDMKLTIHTVGTPGPIEVRVWPDVLSSQCNSENPVASSSAYIEPAGSVEVELPPGHGTVEAVIKNVNFKAIGTMAVQITPVVLVDVPSPGGSVLNPFLSRILYDTTDFASSLEFSCIPAKGASCTP